MAAAEPDATRAEAERSLLDSPRILRRSTPMVRGLAHSLTPSQRTLPDRARSRRSEHDRSRTANGRGAGRRARRAALHARGADRNRRVARRAGALHVHSLRDGSSTRTASFRGRRRASDRGETHVALRAWQRRAPGRSAARGLARPTRVERASVLGTTYQPLVGLANGERGQDQGDLTRFCRTTFDSTQTIMRRLESPLTLF